MKSRTQVIQIGLSLFLIGLSSSVLAQSGGGQDITAMAQQITGEASSIAQLLNVAAYVAGIGFALAGILQFKAHKENPQQTPLSKPVVMILVAAALLFLPTVLQVAGASLFGQSATSAAQFKSQLSGQ